MSEDKTIKKEEDKKESAPKAEEVKVEEKKIDIEKEMDKVTDEKEVKKIKKVKGKKKKVKKQVNIGNVYIKSTYNNTMVTATDQVGNIIAWSSAGICGFKGPKKATPFAAGIIVKDLAEKVKDYGLKDVHVFVKGVGSGRESAVRSLNANGLNVMSIKDVTPIPHNGCRPRKPRRI